MTRSWRDLYTAVRPLAKNAAPAWQPRRQPGAAEEMTARANAAAIVKGEVLPPALNWPAGGALAEESSTAVAGAGRPLSNSERAPLQPHFQRDLSMVRVHTDAEASRSADKMGARAFAYGNDIAFAPGQFALHTAAGSELLAHEVTHSAQQAQAGAASVQMDKKEGKTGIGDAPPAEPFVTMNTVGSEDAFVLFGVNSADLPAADALLKAVGNPSGPVTVHVHGYSSQEGDSEYNLNLSAHRAAAAKKFLQDNLPKDSEIVLFAHGGTSDFGAGEHARGKNRRVGVSVLGSVRPGFHRDYPILQGKLEFNPFGKPDDKPGDTGGKDSSDTGFGFPHHFDPQPTPPFLDFKLSPSLTPRHLMDYNAFHAAVGLRGTGLPGYGDLTLDWDSMFLKYRFIWGLPEEWAARLANWELSGTLKSDAARNYPNAIDRANEDWKTLHPNDTTIGPIMSPDLIQPTRDLIDWFRRKRRKGSK